MSAMQPLLLLVSSAVCVYVHIYVYNSKCNFVYLYVYTSARECLQEMCRVCFCVYLYESVWQNTSLQLPMGDAQNSALGPFFSSKTDHTQKKKQKIRWLDLENNNVNSAGAAALSECLKTNSSLTLLHLSANNIGDTVSSLFLHTHTHACAHMRSRTHKRTHTHTYTLTHTYARICLPTTSATQ